MTKFHVALIYSQQHALQTKQIISVQKHQNFWQQMKNVGYVENIDQNQCFVVETMQIELV